MSEPYQIAALATRALPSKDAIARVNRLLHDWDIDIAEDSLLLLEDMFDCEPEVEQISDPRDALTRIMEWPTLGALDYAGPEGIVTVSYLTEAPRSGLHGVLMSPQWRAVDRTDAVSRYQNLGGALHEILPARRTIMQWALEAQGFRWRDEVARLRLGAFEGTYPLLDLRRSKVD